MDLSKIIFAVYSAFITIIRNGVETSGSFTIQVINGQKVTVLTYAELEAVDPGFIGSALHSQLTAIGAGGAYFSEAKLAITKDKSFEVALHELIHATDDCFCLYGESIEGRIMSEMLAYSLCDIYVLDKNHDGPAGISASDIDPNTIAMHMMDVVYLYSEIFPEYAPYKDHVVSLFVNTFAAAYNKFCRPAK